MSGLTEDSWIYILFLLQATAGSLVTWPLELPCMLGKKWEQNGKECLNLLWRQFWPHWPLEGRDFKGSPVQAVKLPWLEETKHYFCSSVPTHFSVSKAEEPVKLCQDLPVNSCGLAILSFWWEWIRHWDLITKSISFIVTGLVMFCFSSWLIFVVIILRSLCI